MKFESKYNLGMIVYLVTDKEQLERIITGICFRPTGTIYNIVNGVNDYWCYEFEINETRDIILATTG